MADHIDQVNMNDAMLLSDTFSVKEEEYEEDNFIEDKVCISETVITIGNAELQGPISRGKINQYEESTCLDNIKTEWTSIQVIGGQNDNVKTGRGFNSDDIKIEFDNGLLYCEHCEAYYKDYCSECGMLVHILNKSALNNADSGARDDIPNDILEIQDCFGRIGIYALRIIPEGVKFGPLTGLSTTEYAWEMEGERFVLNKNKSKYLNWMQYINPTKNTCDGNLQVFQFEDNIYYQSISAIQEGEELLIYFGEEYRNTPNKIDRVDFVTTTKDIVKDVFACTFCCLGFCSKLHLANHKTHCVENTSGKFSIEELTQCPFCKIYLDPKEYLDHHMAFCSEKISRKGFLLTPPAKYAYVGGKDDQEHSTTDYRNTHVEVEQSCSRDEKKRLKCSLSVFRPNYKQKRAATKHCGTCELGSYNKTDLKQHIKTKHLQEFYLKCDSCEYRTNNKSSLEKHMKTTHLKQFDFKCDSCEYRTNNKSNLETHIKTTHLKKFDFKCDTCKYRTNLKNNLESHIKTKHLKIFHYKCDSCEFRTNSKSHLERHIKTKHLKKFDYKCGECEFGTNNMTDLKKHVKTKHLQEFDLQCNSCEYRTNKKFNLKRHIKTNHLKNSILNVTLVNIEQTTKAI